MLLDAWHRTARRKLQGRAQRPGPAGRSTWRLLPLQVDGDGFAGRNINRHYLGAVAKDHEGKAVAAFQSIQHARAIGSDCIRRHIRVIGCDFTVEAGSEGSGEVARPIEGAKADTVEWNVACLRLSIESSKREPVGPLDSLIRASGSVRRKREKHQTG